LVLRWCWSSIRRRNLVPDTRNERVSQ
jgi:hypothetical protein